MPRDVREKVEGNAWAVFASLSWGMVMWVHRWHPETIQPSLRSSMKYMYVFPTPFSAPLISFIFVIFGARELMGWSWRADTWTRTIGTR